MPTHQAGNTIDLVFSNIPFATTRTCPEMPCGSDHATLMTKIPGRGKVTLEQYHRRVPAPALELYSKVLRQAVERLPDLETIPETGPDLDKYVEAMGECFQDAIQAAGKVRRPVGRAAH